MDQRSAILYAQLKQHKALVNKTSGFIRWALERVRTPYVACSFGKDSAVMLHLVRLQCPDIAVRFIRWKDETEFIDNYDEVIAQWGNLNLNQIELSRESLADKRKERYNTSDFDSYFIGLRASESTVRRITLKKDGMFYKNKAELVRISPLADWQDADVAAYVFSNHLPVLNSYLKDGITSRTASRIPRADYGIRESFVARLKRRDFAAYQQLVIKFPELKSLS